MQLFTTNVSLRREKSNRLSPKIRGGEHANLIVGQSANNEQAAEVVLHEVELKVVPLRGGIDPDDGRERSLALGEVPGAGRCRQIV